jgi:hypothetical protein
MDDIMISCPNIRKDYESLKNIFAPRFVFFVSEKLFFLLTTTSWHDTHSPTYPPTPTCALGLGRELSYMDTLSTMQLLQQFGWTNCIV